MLGNIKYNLTIFIGIFSGITESYATQNARVKAQGGAFFINITDWTTQPMLCISVMMYSGN